MSVRINAVPAKTGNISDSTKLVTEDANDETNKTRAVKLPDIAPWVYALSDEDSPLFEGIKYITEAAPYTRTIKDVVISLKNAPVGDIILVGVTKESGVNTNIFTDFILSNLVQIDAGEFTSDTSSSPITIVVPIWEKGRRILFDIDYAQDGFSSGLKVAVFS